MVPHPLSVAGVLRPTSRPEAGVLATTHALAPPAPDALAPPTSNALAPPYPNALRPDSAGNGPHRYNHSNYKLNLVLRTGTNGVDRARASVHPRESPGTEADDEIERNFAVVSALRASPVSR
jgi:hypothetical protein